MRITDISVSFEKLENLGDYTNVRPKVELRATLDADTVEMALTALTAKAQEALHQIIDDEREMHNLPPRYYDGPLYAVVDFPRYNTLALVPAADVNTLKSDWFGRDYYREPRRLKAAEKLLAEQMQNKHPSYQVFDCATGDLAPLLAYLAEQKAKEEERSKAAVQVAEPDNFPDADWEDDDEEDELGF